MKFIKLITFLALALQNNFIQAETLTPEQVLQQVIDHYPSITRAAIEVERAQQSIKVANSQLGWKLDAQAGIERGVSLLGTSSDIITLGGGVSRMLDSGSSLAFNAALRREDSESVFSPAIANPSTSSNLGVSYRQTLAKNTAHTVFDEARTLARLDVESSLAEKSELYDQLAKKVFDLYFSAAILMARIDNVEHSVTRTKRLQSYINNKTSLGISERKDILQVNAQLTSLIAEKTNLNTSLTKQVVAINRLMARPWDSEIQTIHKIKTLPGDDKKLFIIARDHSPKIKLLESQLALADSAIRTRRDEREDSMDLVWFAGAQNYSGDTAINSVSETELTGGVRFEFKQDVDKSGLDAELYQAQLERGAILQDRKLLLEDLQYDLYGLLAETKSNRAALEAFAKSVKSEVIKVDEAMKRYRSGRIDIDVIIQFEDQLSKAKFSLELQRIALVQRHYQLQILLGDIWKEIVKPEAGVSLR